MAHKHNLPWPPETGFPCTPLVHCVCPLAVVGPWLLLRGKGFESLASPSCGLVSVQSGQSQKADLAWLWVGCYAGMAGLKVLAQPGSGSGAMWGGWDSGHPQMSVTTQLL